MVTKLVATMMSATRDAQAEYHYEVPEADIWTKTPMNIIRTFAQYVGEEMFPNEMVDWEINSSFKNTDLKCVTAIGKLHMGHGEIPFMLMIGEEQ